MRVLQIRELELRKFVVDLLIALNILPTKALVDDLVKTSRRLRL